MKSLLAILLILLIIGCVGEENEGQGFGNILDSPEGLIVTEEEHPDGWGRSDCFACHPIFDIHQVDRTNGLLPLEDIQALVEEEGLAACPICHGDNGVEN
ncbi:MAG: hypothetical protein WBD99_08835 [Thermodesulfobacteriota bacterium]